MLLGEELDHTLLKLERVRLAVVEDAQRDAVEGPEPRRDRLRPDPVDPDRAQYGDPAHSGSSRAVE
jgi:hypothetical protein